jgi:hypothetical protein
VVRAAPSRGGARPGWERHGLPVLPIGGEPDQETFDTDDTDRDADVVDADDRVEAAVLGACRGPSGHLTDPARAGTRRVTGTIR